MCHYYKKLYTCTHLSKTHLHTCRPAILSSKICTPLADPPTSPSDPQCRKSFFPCFDCIRMEAARENVAEYEKRAAEEQERVNMRKENEVRERREREERVRREAVEKTDKARWEPGLWIDAGAARKKGKKGGAAWGGGGSACGGVGGSTPGTPQSAPPVLRGGGSLGRRMGEFSKEMDPEPLKTVMAGDVGGRAGVWRRSSGVGAKKSGGTVERDGWKK